MDKRTIEPLSTALLSFLTPYYHQGRGNATTAKRIVSGLINKNIKTSVLAYDEQTRISMIKKCIHESSLLHVLHFRRFAKWQEENQIQLKKPYIITSGGTDVNIDIFNPLHRKSIGNVLTNAEAVTVFSDDAKQKLLTVYPNLKGKIYIIKQSVWLPENDYVNKVKRIKNSGPNILLPAGLREVKDVLFVLPALVKLKEIFPGLTFTILGTALEWRVLQEVEAAVKKYPWVHYHNEVPLEEMTGFYEQSDVVINSSISEGQSSALLEAMSLNKPVLARDNGGNRSIIKHGQTGFLFNDEDEFYQFIYQLLVNEDLRKRLSDNASNYVNITHTVEEEINSYLSLYEKIIS